MLEKNSGEDLETPKISKALTVISWTESFKNYLWILMGVRNVPLVYVI